MHLHFCLFQEAQTKEILERGTKREKLYVMEDISEGTPLIKLSSGTND
jgi:hypothetical protein